MKSSVVSSAHGLQLLDQKLSRSFNVVLVLAFCGVALMVVEVPLHQPSTHPLL
jgi:hypothetical protein